MTQLGFVLVRQKQDLPNTAGTFGSQTGDEYDVNDLAYAGHYLHIPEGG
jgi:hypothetical protein